jgi:uncharacterized phage protein gp47/JayE
MPLSRPDLPTLLALSESQLLAGLPTLSPVMRRLIVREIARVQSGLIWTEHGYLVWLGMMLMPDTAETDYLDRWGSIFGVTRKPAAAAGPAVFSGNVNIPVSSALPLFAPDGVTLFTTTASGNIGADTTLTLPIAAAQPGAVANLPAGAQLTLGKAIANVAPVATVGGAGTSGGADAESDALYRARVLLRIRTPPQGGATADYLAWTLAQPGVTRAWCFPLHRGPGTVSVAFVMDGRANIIPQAGDVAAVQAAVNVLRPVTADVQVFAPVADPLAVTVHDFQPDSTITRAAVNASIADLLARDAAPGGTIWLNRISAAISEAGGVSHFELAYPVADVVSTSGHMPTFQAVAFT